MTEEVSSPRVFHRLPCYGESLTLLHRLRSRLRGVRRHITVSSLYTRCFYRLRWRRGSSEAVLFCAQRRPNQPEQPLPPWRVESLAEGTSKVSEMGSPSQWSKNVAHNGADPNLGGFPQRRLVPVGAQSVGANVALASGQLGPRTSSERESLFNSIWWIEEMHHWCTVSTYG